MRGSLELYQQTNARLWRQGQNDSRVVIHHIVVRGTMDETVAAALARKEMTQSALIDAVRADIRKEVVDLLPSAPYNGSGHTTR